MICNLCDQLTSNAHNLTHLSLSENFMSWDKITSHLAELVVALRRTLVHLDLSSTGITVSK